MSAGGNRSDSNQGTDYIANDSSFLLKFQIFRGTNYKSKASNRFLKFLDRCSYRFSKENKINNVFCDCMI